MELCLSKSASNTITPLCLFRLISNLQVTSFSTRLIPFSNLPGRRPPSSPKTGNSGPDPVPSLIQQPVRRRFRYLYVFPNPQYPVRETDMYRPPNSASTFHLPVIQFITSSPFSILRLPVKPHLVPKLALPARSQGWSPYRDPEPNEERPLSFAVRTRIGRRSVFINSALSPLSFLCVRHIGFIAIA